MDRVQRAYACWLAIRSGWPINQSTWGVVEETGQVVVEVPRLGTTWGAPFGDVEQVLAAIEAQFGPAQRQRAEGAIGP